MLGVFFFFSYIYIYNFGDGITVITDFGVGCGDANSVD